MSEFKAGDRVRVKPGMAARAFFQDGQEFTVIDTRDGCVVLRGITGGWLPDRFELVTQDSVNHPNHYTAYKGVEVIDLVEQMNFNRGNAIKYVARAGLKNPETEVEDLHKAVWYLQREIARVEATGD